MTIKFIELADGCGFFNTIKETGKRAMEESGQNGGMQCGSSRKLTILLCGNGKSGEVIPFIKAWGYRVCLISEFPNDACTEHVDQFVFANPMDPKEALDAAKGLVADGWVFDGVISLCWDCPISVATIAQELGLPSIPVSTAELSTFKDLRIKALRAAEVLVPDSVTLQADQIEEINLPFSYPVVTKPVDLSGSVGVFLAADPSELSNVVNKTTQYLALSKNKTIQIEQYIDGTEYSVEGLVQNGRINITGLSERVFLDKFLPAFVERGDIIPSDLSEEQVNEVYSVCQKSIDALGITSGAVKFDIKISGEGQIYIFEVTPRLGGPRFGTEMIPLANGTSILRALLAQACGLPIQNEWLLPNNKNAVVAFKIFAPKSGRIVKLKGLESARLLPGFYDFKWSRPSGYIEGDIIKEGQELGYYIICSSTRISALEKAERLEEIFEFEVAQ